MPMPRDVRPTQLAPDGGKLWPAMFHSQTLDLRCNVFVYAPPGVGRAGRTLAALPVLYLLHGMWGSEIDWPFKGDAQAILDREILAGRVRPMLVAMPHDGLADNGTFYSNWFDSPLPQGEGDGGHAAKTGRSLRFEDYFITDLRRFVEVELAGRERSRAQRAIAGLSMGGFGSLTLSLRRPELFAGAASMSGAVRPIGDFRYPELGSRIFGPLSDDPASYRRQRDPAVLVERLRGQSPPARPQLYLDCGDRDMLLTMNRKLHRKLLRLGVDHEYREYAGAHDWPSWRKRLPHVLRFLSARLADG